MTISHHDLRLEAGLSQEELAKRAGLSQAMVSRIERGERYPNPEMAKSIAKALNFKGIPYELVDLETRERRKFNIIAMKETITPRGKLTIMTTDDSTVLISEIRRK